MNSRASPRRSWMSRPRNSDARCGPSVAPAVARARCASARQGVHHEAHRFSTTGTPRSSRERQRGRRRAPCPTEPLEPRRQRARARAPRARSRGAARRRPDASAWSMRSSVPLDAGRRRAARGMPRPARPRPSGRGAARRTARLRSMPTDDTPSAATRSFGRRRRAVGSEPTSGTLAAGPPESRRRRSPAAALRIAARAAALMERAAGRAAAAGDSCPSACAARSASSSRPGRSTATTSWRAVARPLELSYQALLRDNMVEELRRLRAALELDLVGPDDFCGHDRRRRFTIAAAP